MRVSEVTGLRWEDIDLKKKEISVNHTLVYRKYPGESSGRLHISTPKSEKGSRIIPMIGDVEDAFRAEYVHQQKVGFYTAQIDGMCGFVFCGRFGTPLHQGLINKAILRIVNDYNVEEELKAASEDREPFLIPRFSCHNIRHTFATQLCENETNIKAIQEIMGHADIQTTMNIYAKATDTSKQKAMENLEEGSRIF